MTRHHIHAEHTLDTEHDDGLPECEVRIHFNFYPYQPERGPSYASGGEPAEPASVEFDRVERELDGKWVEVPEFNDWADAYLMNDGLDRAMEAACEDNEPDPDDQRDAMIERRQMEREFPFGDEC